MGSIAPGPSIDSMSGKYSSVKSLSDDANGALALQGIPWLVRKALGIATVVLVIEQKTDANGVPVLAGTMTAGPKTKSETRILDWSEVPSTDPGSGAIITQSRYFTDLEMACGGSEADRAFLAGETLKDGSPSSWAEDGSKNHIQVFTRAKDGSWCMEQTWGFETIKGVKYHSRRMVVIKGKDVERCRYIYSFA